jgi:DNA-binding XRE family transcriptional regulator
MNKGAAMTIKVKRSGASATLVDLRARYALSRATLADWLGVAETTLENWETRESGAAPLIKIKKIAKILDGLARVMKEEYIPTWLASSNDACDGRTPVACLKGGDFQTVEDLVYFLQAGEPV